jgi:hypothetical protein
LTPHSAVARERENVVDFWGALDSRLGSLPRALIGNLRCHCSIAGNNKRRSSITVQDKWENDDYNAALLSAPTLTYLMEHCQNLKALTLQHLALGENHCRVLDVYSRPTLEIVLDGCKLTSAGTSALVEAFRRNQGPTGLHRCDIDYCILADGLRGKSRLKNLVRKSWEWQNLERPHSNRPRNDCREVLALLGCPPRNRPCEIESK